MLQRRFFSWDGKFKTSNPKALNGISHPPFTSVYHNNQSNWVVEFCRELHQNHIRSQPNNPEFMPAYQKTSCPSDKPRVHSFSRTRADHEAFLTVLLHIQGFLH